MSNNNKLKNKMESVVGEGAMQALASNPSAVLIARKMFNLQCNICKQKSLREIRRGRAWDKSLLCSMCRKRYDEEESKWN